MSRQAPAGYSGSGHHPAQKPHTEQVYREVTLPARSHVHTASGKDIQEGMDLRHSVPGGQFILANGTYSVIVELGNIGLAARDIPAVAEELPRIPFAASGVSDPRKANLAVTAIDQVAGRPAARAADARYVCVHGPP